MDEYINAFQYREKKADEVRAEIAAEKARIAEEQARIEAEKNKPWYEKAWEGTKVFAGEVSGYNDTVRATTGVDPVTGRKLSEAERVAAGAMAAAGFIPVVGWAGRAIKGGAAIVKTAKPAKTMNAATHSLDAYKTTKGMEILSKTEKGIYGLYTGNSAWEFGTGTDMFGNQLTEEQRMNALWGGLTMGAAGGAAHIIDKGGLRKLADKAPYSTAYVKEQTGKANQTLKQMGNRVGSKAEDALRSSANAANKLATHTKGAVNQVTKKMANINVPSSVRVYSMDANGVRIPVVDVEKKRLGDMIELTEHRGKLKGKDILLRDIVEKEIIYTKRDRQEFKQLRNKFNSSVRKLFLKDIVNDEKKVKQLINAGLTDIDIKNLKNGLVPDGYQVHHKLPLDDGGTNDFKNLILIENDPFHKVLTNSQKSLTKGLKVGEQVIINWPLPEGFIYPTSKK
ncbi:pre-toxin TG domain-containing protein [Metabacillus sp. 84]|uniref:pre-toxin TG domain-containing protein n=1 Tax=Metabacillus sp. 84 TaxID=3404705 RepID=UPI003CEA2875